MSPTREIKKFIALFYNKVNFSHRYLCRHSVKCSTSVVKLEPIVLEPWCMTGISARSRTWKAIIFTQLTSLLFVQMLRIKEPLRKTPQNPQRRIVSKHTIQFFLKWLKMWCRVSKITNRLSNKLLKNQWWKLLALLCLCSSQGLYLILKIDLRPSNMSRCLSWRKVLWHVLLKMKMETLCLSSCWDMVTHSVTQTFSKLW